MRAKKIAIGIILGAFFFYVFWLGIQILRFKRYGSEAGRKKEAVSLSVTAGSGQRIPTPSAYPPPYEIEGVYHLHSLYSDGRKSIDQIVRIATEEGLDFLILTDHGKPNFAALNSQGWKSGVLLLAGSELSVSRGHLVGLGFRTPDPSTSFAQNAEEAACEIASLGGFTVIAHPYSKTSWSWGETSQYSGLEIIDADSTLRSHFLASLPYLPALLIKPEVALLHMVDPPDRTMAKWDRLLGQGQMHAYFSVDAHYLYRAVFRVFHLHVLLDEPPSPSFEQASAQVFGALRMGNFYSAVDAAAAAKGFRFWAEDSGKIWAMGSSISSSAEGAEKAKPLVFHVETPFPFAFETRVIHDGKPVARSREQNLSLEADGPGPYRVEVYLREKSPLVADCPWIVSNPIFLGKESR
jgi:hypothetical protein